MLNSIDTVQEQLLEQNYVADAGLSTIIFLALRMGKPLFLEGEAGVGKTEVAKVLAQILQTNLIRLQCYEGLDIHNAVYEWDYSRQILHLRILEASGANRAEMQHGLYDRDFLLARPLLQALEQTQHQIPVLLIDEVDRADEEFESFLLEILSDFQISIPEIGTIYAEQPPVVILTSNRTREVHDALKRRCLYHWINYPSFETEYRIVMLKVPGISQRLTHQIVSVVQQLRSLELFKAPGAAETLDWAQALQIMDVDQLDEQTVHQTLGVLLKYQDDVQRIQGAVTRDLVKRADHDNR
ncbi:MAG TPA: MoxR family ATPase [Aggregatilineales bacterium]|nr:MoxR family ATPase [Aggregatilineales bacterium]